MPRSHPARQVLALCLTGLMGWLHLPVAQAQGTAMKALPDAQASDPTRLGIMQGFPPPVDKRVRIDDGSTWKFPNTRWAFSHMREMMPTAPVWRGAGRPSELPRAERADLDAVAFTTLDGRPMTWAQSLAANYTDGILVLHRGQVVYEKYFGALDAHTPHIAMSVTKSFVGTLAALLVDQGRLDPQALVTRYVPELGQGAYADATVRQVMDMTVGVRYSESYADPQAEIWDYIRAGGSLPFPPGYQGPRNLYDFLVALKKEGEHGRAFAYKTPNAEVLGWVLQRATGQSTARLLSEQLWQKLGVEEDAYFATDSLGTATAGGGLALTLRDLGRVGELFRLGGRANGQQILPAAVVADIRQGGDLGHFAQAGYATLPGWSYRDMWWVSHNAHGAFAMRGIHGQALWIDPKAEMVIARFASNPVAANSANDPVSLPAYAALAQHLMAVPGR